MKKLANLFLNNFWVRNLSVLLLLFSLITFVEVYNLTTYRIFYNIAVSIIIYSWLTFHNRILIDVVLKSKRYLIYVVGVIAGLTLYTFATFALTPKEYNVMNIIPYVYYAFFNTILGLLFYNSFKYYKAQQQFLKNKLYMFEMEQKYLKNQLSPHFLFNTLNNIYSYSLIESKKTPELILKLSELMRYLTQFNKSDTITLKDEVNFIENYIAFERERLEDRCDINFVKHLDNEQARIEPLIFFPLIENAFKHGTNTMDQCYVDINIKQKEGILEVQIRNKIFDTKKPSTHSGIENVEKRLNLFYKGHYNLRAERVNGEYLVNLMIELNGN